MADSTTNLDQVSASQAQKEVIVNELVDALSPGSIFGPHASTSVGRVFGYYGGRINGTLVPNGTVTATASATNYVVAHRTTFAVSISTSTTNWLDTTNYGHLYILTAGAASITNREDHRVSTDGTGIFTW